jgi:hypothetical protein
MRNKCAGKQTHTFFDKYDAFGTKMPELHMEGQKKVGTSIGFILTVFVGMGAIGYAIPRAVGVFKKE